MKILQKLLGEINKQRKLLLIVVIMLAFITSLCLFMIHIGNTVIESTIDSYLSEISQQTAYKVNQRVDDNFDKLNTLKKAFKYMDENEQNNYMKEMTENSAFEWFGVVSYQEGKLLDQTNQYDFSNQEVIKEAIEGKKGLSEELVKNNYNESGLIYAIPYSENKAIVGWIPTTTMRLLLDTDNFDGLGFSHIVSQKGNYILHSQNENVLLKGNNFIDYIDDNDGIIKGNTLKAIKADFAKNNNGVFDVYIGAEHRSIVYTYLDNTGWYILTSVPPMLYTSDLNSYINTAVTTIAISITGILAILFVSILYINKKKTSEIKKLAFIDPITNGFTSARFEKELKNQLNRKGFKSFAFVFLDIKRFKLINDSFGSENGNRVLNYVYRCITSNLKEGEYASRIAADNFNVVFKTIDQDEINKRLKKIAADINQFNKGKKAPYLISIMCGTYIVNDNDSVVIIRDRANMARKNNEDKGQQLCTNIFYNDVERIQVIKEREIENAMAGALENKEFKVYLQPKVGLKSGKIIGAEALVRWQHPNKGMIFPDEFIPVFEKNDFIRKLDFYVFEQVCIILREWIDEGIEPLKISVNLSRRHLYNDDFLKEYQRIQKKYSIPAYLLEIELTETIVFENLSSLKQIVKEIHELGYQCSMDDFGSGYSSLNVLKEIPVDILKLDRAFFSEEDNKRSNDVVESIIYLAKKLGMKTVAEGVETMPQVTLLKKMDCDMVQGYVFEKAIPVAKFKDILINNPYLMENSTNKDN